MKPGILWVLLIVLTAGCGGVSPKSSYYLLGTAGHPPLDRPAPKDLSLGIGSILIPGHLDRSEIVTRINENGVVVNEFHRWGAPLARQIRERLMANLSALLGTPRVVLSPWERSLSPVYQVDAAFLTFGKENGRAMMEVIWHLRTVEDDRVLIFRKFSAAIPVTGPDMGAYVGAQTKGLENLSREIAGEIFKFVSDHHPPGHGKSDCPHDRPHQCIQNPPG